MLLNSPLDLVFDDLFVSIEGILENNTVNLKLEGSTIGGSVKMKPALKMIGRLEMSGQLKKGGTVIESTSGNLGIALSIICAVKGYNFICVVDPHILEATEKLISAYGAEIVKVTKFDDNGGYLSTRIKYIKDAISCNKDIVWVNQYENLDNAEAHYLQTAPEIAKQFPKIDYLFIGAGTTGTLSGVSRYIRPRFPNTKIIAVDAVGSVNFGNPSGKRFIPGLGASKEMPLSRLSIFDTVLLVHELDTIKMCHRMVSKGLLFGGSTGTVLSAIEQYRAHIPEGSKVVGISPDFGERYLDTIYNPVWVSRCYPTMRDSDIHINNHQNEESSYNHV
ncbi:MAG: 2,3-diaminopropionate biosynthesis protein SbnA [Arenicella sp.]|jgi:2,3-diaminopropionate biosynthesis protein SbnA